jgi:hypothetical protein
MMLPASPGRLRFDEGAEAPELELVAEAVEALLDVGEDASADVSNVPSSDVIGFKTNELTFLTSSEERPSLVSWLSAWD